MGCVHLFGMLAVDLGSSYMVNNFVIHVLFVATIPVCVSSIPVLTTECWEDARHVPSDLAVESLLVRTLKK